MKGAWVKPLIDATQAIDLVQPVRFVEDCATLDLRFLMRCWEDLKDDTLGGAYLDWPPEMVEGVDHFLITCDTRTNNRPTIVATFEQDGETKRQVIKLAFAQLGARRYLRMKCPVTGDLCDVLYFRGGRFASRVAQRLVHRSQRRAPQEAAA